MGPVPPPRILLTSMNLHYMMGDFTKPVVVEPETDVSPIADHYNLVLKKNEPD